MRYAIIALVVTTVIWIASSLFLFEISYTGETMAVVSMGGGDLFLGRWYQVEKQTGWKYIVSGPDPYRDELSAFGRPQFMGFKLHRMADNPLRPGTFVMFPLWIIVLPPLALMVVHWRKARKRCNREAGVNESNA